MNKRQFDKIYVQPETVIYCETRELKNEFLSKAHEFGYKWRSGDSYVQVNTWYDSSYNNTCYYIYDGTYGTEQDYIDRGYKIIKFEGWKNMKIENDFTKEDLQTGHIVTLRDNTKYTVIKNSVLKDSITSCDNINGYILLDGYDDNLSCSGNRSFDIIKVDLPLHHYSMMGKNDCHNNLVELIWERKEVKEMKMVELNELLGYEVKIIK